MYNRLKIAVFLRRMKMKEFYAKTGLIPSTLMRKCERGQLTVKEIKIIRDALQLSRDEMYQIFFEGQLA